MNMFFDWWFATSLRLRQFCWAVWLLVLVTLIFLSLTHHEESDALIPVSYTHLDVYKRQLLQRMTVE